MNTNALTRQAIRLAQRKSAKRGRILTRDEVLKLHVQTIDPWKRLLIAMLGLGVIAFAVLCYYKIAPWWTWLPLGLGGVAAVVIGFIGKKNYFDQELATLMDADRVSTMEHIGNAIASQALDKVIDEILDGLG